MSNHTRAPWYFEDSGEGYEVFSCDKNNEFDESVGGDILREEDARLIAAAPDLLKALIEIIKYVEYKDWGIELYIDNARRAIEKATQS